MEIRKFVFTIASKFDARGFKAAENAAKKLGTLASGTAKSVGELAKAHARAGTSAEKAAEKAVKAAAREAAATKREAERAGKARERARERSIKAEKKALASLSAAERKYRQTALQADIRFHQRRIREAQEAEQRRERAIGAGKQAFGDLRNVGATLARGAAVGITGFAGLGAAVINTGVSFESLRARLKTVEGSAEGANKAFRTIQDFTKSTPFQLDEVTNAYVRLKNIGLDASKESLTAFGNIAAAQGKSIIDFIEAVADASTGEFERLKEFGIKASKQGEQVTFTFKGQQTVVKNTADDISAFLRGIGESDFAGAMTDQMATASGLISNLKDSVSSFFDQVSQMGVLDEFKGLLTDLATIGGGEGGFAEIVAEMLVTGLQALREAIQGVTAEDIRGFLNTAQEAVEGLADVVGVVIEALRSFTEMAGSTEESIKLLTLGVIALAAAFNGPAGLTFAVFAVGVALGRMVAGALLDMDELDARISQLDENIRKLKAEIAESEKNIQEAADAVDENIAKQKQREEEQRKRNEQNLKGTVGGLGAGLLKEGTTEDQAFALRQIQKGTDEQQQQGMEKLFTAEGRQVFEAVTKAERQRVDDAEKRARREARKQGRDEDAAARSARSAVIESNRAGREKAFKAASETFAKTGSADLAAEAAIKKATPKELKGKKGKEDTFFDFEKQAAAAAKQQGETFAEQELQRLAAEGITGKEAIAQAQAAGKKRAEELEQRFIEAGRIFDASADNILDILGLRGPGSVLEGRPPPQTLLITIAPVFKFIENFTQTIESVAGAKALAEVTGQAGQTAAEQGLMEGFERFQEMFRAALALETERLLKADGGGKLPPGPQG